MTVSYNYFLMQCVPTCHSVWCSLGTGLRATVFNDTACRLNCVPQWAFKPSCHLAGFVNVPDLGMLIFFFFFNNTTGIAYIGVGIFIFLICKQVDQGQQNKYDAVLRSM